MSEKNWQPGDVALRVGPQGNKCLALRVNRCAGMSLGHMPHWHFVAEGVAETQCGTDNGLAVYRPLVVIDPEDRKQVEALMRSVRDGTFRAGDTYPGMGKFADAMQAALREFANPKPRIEEPQGLGAVVVDADGVEYLRVARRAGDSADWHRMTDRTDAPHLWWREFEAVRVVNEGAKRGEPK